MIDQARLLQCIKHLPFLSVAQLADICRVPGDCYVEFAQAIRAGVEAGEIEHRIVTGGGCEIPVFKANDSQSLTNHPS